MTAPAQNNITGATKPTAPGIINKDGTLNIHRTREPGKLFFDLYHYFLFISWPVFFSYLVLFFLGSNIFFAVLYFEAGPAALNGVRTGNNFDHFIDCFFFSVQLLNGPFEPMGLWMNVLVALQTYLGLMVLVIVTGLFYARFARPSARVIFSENALINQYNGRPCFTFRVANERMNHIVEARMTLTLTRNATSLEGESSRKFYNMPLERDYTPLFALSWTIRHFIDEESPLVNMSLEDMRAAQVVVFASLTGIDDTFSQSITARSAYRYDEIVKNKRFKDIILFDGTKARIDLKGISDLQ